MEFLIKPIDSKWFEFNWVNAEKILHPITIQYKTNISPHKRFTLKAFNSKFVINEEDPGLHIYKVRGNISESESKLLIEEICENIKNETGEGCIFFEL